MFKLKELMKSVSNQTLAQYSCTSHVRYVLVCLTNSLIASLVTFVLQLTVFQEENG